MIKLSEIVDPRNYNRFKFDVQFGSFIGIGDAQWLNSPGGRKILSNELKPVDLKRGILPMVGLTQPKPDLEAADPCVHDEDDLTFIRTFTGLYKQLPNQKDIELSPGADSTVYSAAFSTLDQSDHGIVITLLYAEPVGLVAARTVFFHDMRNVRGFSAKIEFRGTGASNKHDEIDCVGKIRDMAYLHWQRSKEVAEAKRSPHVHSIRLLIDAARANSELKPIEDAQFDEIVKLFMQ
jgi:hypothetical protein